MKIDVQLGLNRVRSMSYAAPDGLSDFGRKSVTPKHTSVSMKDDFGLGEDESSPNKLTNFEIPTMNRRSTMATMGGRGGKKGRDLVIEAADPIQEEDEDDDENPFDSSPVKKNVEKIKSEKKAYKVKEKAKKLKKKFSENVLNTIDENIL